jgi:hypothetical protein
MDPELVALASTGASTLVTLMATDAWDQAKRAVAALFARSRPEAISLVERELDESRSELVAALDRGDDLTEPELITQWQGRLRRLLATDPGIETALRALVDDLEASASHVSIRTENIEMRAKASDHGRVYQQGQGVQYNR